MPPFPGIDVPHVLKAEIVGDFTWGQKGVRSEIACQESEPVESDSVELRLIGHSLFDRVPFRVIARLLSALGIGLGRPSVLPATPPILRRPNVLAAAPWAVGPRHQTLGRVHTGGRNLAFGRRMLNRIAGLLSPAILKGLWRRLAFLRRVGLPRSILCYRDRSKQGQGKS